MDGVTKWAAALCVAAVGCTALQMLAPKGGLGRLFKLITAAFFICCMAAPLLSLKSIDTLDLEDFNDGVSADSLEDEVYDQFKEQVTNAVKQIAENTLASYDIQVTKVEVEMDTDENDSIYISSVTLYLDKQDQSQALVVKQVMEEKLGVEVSVKV